MKNQHTLVAAAVAALLLAGGAPVQAQSSRELDELRQEIKRLREEVNELKKGKAAEAKPALPPDSPGWGDRIEALEIKSKDAVVVGDIANSSRIPGSDTSVHLYGFAELNLVSEFKADNSNNDYSTFVPYAPVNGTNKRKGQTYLHARTSRIGIDAATPSEYGPVSVKIEGDFNNEPRTGGSQAYGTTGNIYTQQVTNSYGFRIRHAYGQFGGLLIGQTWSTFMDVDNSPETVDFNGPIGSTFIRQPQVRYAYGTKDWGTFTAAAENSDSYVLDKTGAVITDGFSKWPDLIGRWDKGFDGGSFSTRVLVQELRLKSADGMTSARSTGYGLGGTVLLKMRDAKDFLSVAVTYGNGIGRYFNYIEGAFYDDVQRSILKEKALGLVVGYQFKASDTLRANFVAGWQKNFDNGYTGFARDNGLDSGAPGSALGQFAINRSVIQLHNGVIYNPLKNIDFGAEYIWGQRKTLAGEKGDTSRINLSGKYYFN